MQWDRILAWCAGIGMLSFQAVAMEGVTSKLVVTVGKSLSIDSPLAIKRVSLSNNTLAETVVIGPKEILLNGKAPGETSLVIWQEGDIRRTYDVLVRPSNLRLDAVRDQIAREVPGDEVDVSLDNDTAFVRGTVKDMLAADRVVSIASTLGKVVNLLHVKVPPAEKQILLKVRFANIDRSAGRDLGLQLSSGAMNQTTALGTGQPLSVNGNQSFSIGSAINLFLFRRDINLAAAIQALETKRLLELLAEPNLLVINGTAAHFTAGGEFPYPMIQPGGGSNSVTISFKEYGIRLGFLPTVTPRGTIRLQVTPEVSALDYTNSVTVAGTTVPGTSTRKVQTEVELESGQTFVVAGLLDEKTTETLSKIPGIGDIPLLGKLFQQKSETRSRTELLVIITPEIVRPIPEGQPVPSPRFPEPLGGMTEDVLVHHPGMDITGPVPVRTPAETVPQEVLAPKKDK